MSYKGKSRYIAEQSIASFFDRNRVVYFLTFTEPGRKEGEQLWTKDEAENHFKPFRDLCRRMGIDLLVVWERQRRGSWHPHCLVNRRFDVNWLRPWMVARGWGIQMEARLIGGGAKRPVRDEHGNTRWTAFDDVVRAKVIRYLTKYLSKEWTVPRSVHKKVFGGSASSKVGNTKFKWLPEVCAASMLWFYGAQLHHELYGERATFKDMASVIRLGVEACDWSKVDPWWEFSVPGS